MRNEENGATTESVKLPQAGEWWGRKYQDSFHIVYIVGKNHTGRLLYETACGDLDTESICVGWRDWEHLPDCTGFDWVEPQPTRVPVPLFIDEAAFNGRHGVSELRAFKDGKGLGAMWKLLKWCPDIGFYYESNE